MFIEGSAFLFDLVKPHNWKGFTMSDFPNVTWRRTDELRPNPNNPRTHSAKQVRQIRDSIEAFGWTVPVLIDETGAVLAGHGRLAAARLLGLEKVPTLQFSHMSEAQKKAYALADNRIAELSGWDNDLLRVEFESLIELDPAFDLEVTGFDLPEIEVLTQTPVPEEDPADRPVDDGASPPVTVPGDLWLLNDHRILCGDALARSSYRQLLEQRKARMVFTDPPYNVPIDGHVSGLGKIRHREFAMASGEMTEEEFTDFLATVFGQMARVSCNGALHYVCMDWRHMGEVLDAGNETYGPLRALCVWNKTNGGMGSFYRSRHELVFVFRNGNRRHINNIELGRHGRNRTNVWDYPGVNSFGGSRTDLALHPTVKPVQMIADAILDCSRRGDIVLDPFLGSGSTLLAAERTGRLAYGMEIDPAYVDTAIRRWQAFTGGDAIHAASGQTFTEREQARDHEQEHESEGPETTTASRKSAGGAR